MMTMADMEAILIAYKDGKDVDEQDIAIIDELASIGLMTKGMSLRRKKVTAKTTSLGMKLIS